MSITRDRLFLEVKAVRERWGNEPVLRTDNTKFWWECTLVQNGRKLPIRIEYPPGYPNTMPKVYTRDPLPEHGKHTLSASEPCWTDYSGKDWKPGHDTAATAIAALHRWFACYLVWLTTKKWPSGADHD